MLTLGPPEVAGPFLRDGGGGRWAPQPLGLVCLSHKDLCEALVV